MALIYAFQTQKFQKKLTEILDRIGGEQLHLHHCHTHFQSNGDDAEAAEHDKTLQGVTSHSVPVHEMQFPQLFVY